MTFAQSLLVFFVMPILNVIVWVIIIEIVLSWLLAFRVIDPNGIFGQIGYGLRRFTAPLLDPIRSRLPSMGGLDISPIILILLISWVNNFLIGQKLLPMLG